MYKYLLLLSLLWSCHEPYIPDMIMVDEFNEISSLFQKSNDTTYIINFWATTCPPCIKEMPYFEKLNEDNKHQKVSITMISLDANKRIESHVRPFLHKLNIKNRVIALTDQNYTKWTAQINPKWFGALPYTVIYKKDKKRYFFGAFESYQDLKDEVDGFLK